MKRFIAVLLAAVSAAAASEAAAQSSDVFVSKEVRAA